jgi:hypothetical protein
VLGKRHGDGCNWRVAVPALEGAVVNADHPRMRFPESAPQR